MLERIKRRLRRHLVFERRFPSGLINYMRFFGHGPRGTIYFSFTDGYDGLHMFSIQNVSYGVFTKIAFSATPGQELLRLERKLGLSRVSYF